MAPASDAAVGAADLRVHLREATMAAHDLLDTTMQAASGWQSRGDYARFLALQHAARVPLEAWLDANAPDDLCPPPQTELLAADLAALGHPLPVFSPALAPALPRSSSGSGTALGAAWVLAGSALGNRTIAKQVARIGRGSWPMAFLGDKGMMAFWQSLRARIERPASPAEAAGAAEAAAAVFAHFLKVAERADPTPERVSA